MNSCLQLKINLLISLNQTTVLKQFINGMKNLDQIFLSVKLKNCNTLKNYLLDTCCSRNIVFAFPKKDYS
jgi:hypothetical protein